MNTYHTVVVGGGISGLSLAHYNARAGHVTLVLERDDEPGGTFRSCKGVGDFWLELGAHTCYNSYRNFIGLLRDCGLKEQIQARSKVPYRILTTRGLQSVFSQVGLLELLVSVPRLFLAKKAGRSVAAYYGDIVGRGNFTRLFSAVFSAVPSQKADDFPADMLFKKRMRDKSVAKNFTLRNGLQSVAEVLAAQPNVDFCRGKDVIALERTRSGEYKLQTACGTTYRGAHLALAAPPPDAARLLAQVAPQLAQHLGQIAVARVESIGVAVARKRLNLEPVAGIIPRDDCFFSAVSRDVLPHDAYRGFTFHFAPDVLDRAGKIGRIAAILRVDPTAVEYVGEKTSIVPSPRLGHDAWLQETERLLQETGILLTGNYFAGLSIEDCVTRSLQQVQRLQEGA